MRLKITLYNPIETALPINYQHYLTGAIYDLLGTSDADYARFLHDEGYAPDDGPTRFKLFVFSWLRFTSRRRPQGDRLPVPPGPIEWLISSPVEPFLTHCATGLLSAQSLRVGPSAFAITEVATLPSPDFSTGAARFSCLSPIVAALPRPAADGGGTRYLRPADGAEFSDAIHRNLCRKYATLYGRPPGDDRFHLTFDPSYLARDRNGGTKNIRFKEINIIGAFCPFTVSGSKELLQVGYECGVGEKNASGFGMVSVVH